MAGSDERTLIDADDETEETEAPRWVGRYLVLEEIAAGGMGVVFKAYDPSLQRHVAVKLLRHAGGRQDRLHREGQAIAQLSHANVVAVHDLGYQADQLYIAMEYVPGRTLGDWLDGAHTLEDILAVMLQAARGLAAGHAKGIVHRDVKPSNVLVGDDGIVRVVDFGLARASDESVPPSEAPEALSPDSLEDTLTRQGALLGTPRYMAPEQYLGKDVNARADQYAYCVVLYEALVGASPFAPLDLAAFRALSEPREVIPIPAPARVPAWLERIVLRGLAPDPNARYPSMDALIDDLATDHGAVRRRNIGIGVTVVALAAVGFALASNRGHASPCASAGAPADELWTAKARRDAAPAFASAIDGRLQQWRDMRIDSCKATHERREQSDVLFDRRVACLDRRLAETAALVAAVAAADNDEQRERGIDAVQDLTPVSACADAEALMRQTPPPEDPARRAQVDAVFARIDEGFSLSYLGRNDDALAIADPTLAEARATEHPPVIAEALALASAIYNQTGAAEKSEATLWEMYAVAAAGKDDAGMADALIALLNVIGHPHAGKAKEAAALVPVVEGLAMRSGDPELIAKMWLNTGLVRDYAGNFDDAERRYVRARDDKAALFGEDSVEVAHAIGNLGAVAAARGEMARAAELYEQELAIKRAKLGDDHPAIARSLFNLGVIYERTGKYEQAIERWNDGLAIMNAAQHPDPQVHAFLYLTTADALLKLERLPEALAAAQAGADVVRKAYGEQDAMYGEALFRVARLHYARDEFEQSVTVARRAVATMEALDPSSTTLSNPLAILGQALCAQNEFDEGAAALERALAVADASDYAKASPTFSLAQCRWDQGKRREALALARRAKALYESSDEPSATLQVVVDWLAERTR